MATLQEINSNLLLAISTRNIALVTSTVNSITESQKPLLSQPLLGNVLNMMAEQTWNTGDDTAVRDFMSKLGAYVHAQEISLALLTLASDSNFSGIDAVTDYITATQKPLLSQPHIGNVLNIMAEQTWSSGDDTVINTAIRDFMSKLGAYVHPLDIGQALLTLASDSNFVGIDAITDYITATQKPLLSQPHIGNVLNMIAEQTWNTGDDTAVNTAIRDFMSKLGAYIHVLDISQALLTLASDSNFVGIDAITDYITATQKPLLSQPHLGNVLNMMTEQTWASGNDTAVNTAVRDFMSKLGAYVHAQDIGRALLTLASDSNFAGIDAITDYITATQKPLLSQPHLGGVLNMMAEQTWASGDDTAVNTAARDFMVKLGAYTDIANISSALQNFAYDGNHTGADAIIDNLSNAQLVSLVQSPLGAQLLAMGYLGGSAGADSINGSAGNNVIFALGGNDTVHGNNGNDHIYGGKGTDYLYGDAGNDFLSGGADSDVLYGGTGADTFFLGNKAHGDLIADFKISEGDKLDIGDILIGFDPLQDVITDFVRARNSGVHTVISIASGPESNATFTDVAFLMNINNLDVTKLFNQGQIIAT